MSREFRGGGKMAFVLCLFTVLAFPILLPVLISGISATKKAVTQPLLEEASGELQAIIAYAVVIITASIMLFDFIWEE